MKTMHSVGVFIVLIISLLSSCYSDKVPFSDSSEKITFSSGQFQIHGELLLPKGNNHSPLVIMVHGDGPAYHDYFKVLKESMLKSGYATLMWDKPGFGKSTGRFTEKMLKKERAKILLQAINEMQKHPKIDGDKIGLWGISQAGYVIPMALEKTDQIKFMILVGCGGENGIKQTAYLIKEQLICGGYQEAKAKQAEMDFTMLFYSETYKEYLSHAKPLVENPVIKKLGFVTAIWTKDKWKPYAGTEEAFYDPILVFERTKIPTLVFFGDLDKNVDPVQGMEAFNQAFQKAGNQNYQVNLIKGADHNIIISETGCMSERRTRSGEEWSHYDPAYLKKMEKWLMTLNNENSQN